MGSTNVIPFQGGKVPAVLQQLQMDGDDLTSGVTGGFAVVSIRGSKFRVKHQGEEHPVLNADGDAASSLEVVLVKANKHISKNFYDQGYEEGASEAPTCFSMDGVRPDPSVQTPVSDACAKCPKNVFGSRITPAGKKAKACQDNRRVAVVPGGDLKNDIFGGPMLLRVPAASLADLKMFGEGLKARGFPYNGVLVRLSFDIDASYPKLMFKAVRPLSDAEAAVIVEHLNGEQVDRVLAEAVELAAEAGQQPATQVEVPPPPPKPKAVDVEFEEPAPAPKPAAKPAAAKPQAATAAKPAAAKVMPAAAPKPAAAAPVRQKAAPVVEAEVISDSPADPGLEADIEGILADLDV